MSTQAWANISVGNLVRTIRSAFCKAHTICSGNTIHATAAKLSLGMPSNDYCACHYIWHSRQNQCFAGQGTLIIRGGMEINRIDVDMISDVCYTRWPVFPAHWGAHWQGCLQSRRLSEAQLVEHMKTKQPLSHTQHLYTQHSATPNSDTLNSNTQHSNVILRRATINRLATASQERTQGESGSYTCANNTSKHI